MQTVLISTRTHDPVKTDAEIVGPFAIHATPKGNCIGRRLPPRRRAGGRWACLDALYRMQHGMRAASRWGHAAAALLSSGGK